MDADDGFDEGVEEGGEDVVFGLLEGVGEVVDCDGDFVDLEERVVVGGGEIGRQFDLGGDAFVVHLPLAISRGRGYVNIEKTLVLELKESSLLAEGVTDISCSDTEFIDVNRGCIAVLRLECICAGELGVRISINTYFAGQEVIRLKDKILNDKINIRILILDPRNRDISHQRNRLRKHNIDYNQIPFPKSINRNHAKHQTVPLQS